jgi:hypothetical protein
MMFGNSARLYGAPMPEIRAASGPLRWVDCGWTALPAAGSPATQPGVFGNCALVGAIGRSPRFFQSTHGQSLSAESLQQHTTFGSPPRYDPQENQPFLGWKRQRYPKTLPVLKLAVNEYMTSNPAEHPKN